MYFGTAIEQDAFTAVITAKYSELLLQMLKNLDDV